MDTREKEYWMGHALKEARKAYSLGEVPIGAVLVKDGEVLGRGHNLKEQSGLATDHAEIRAIEEANQRLGHWRLEGASMFVTVEPCLMCAGAILNARLEAVYFGASDPKGGAVESLYHTLSDDRLNHSCLVQGGLLEDECAGLMRDFFKDLRQKKKNKKRKKSE